MTAAHVVVAAGTWGTQHLLHYAKDSGSLPRLSGALGRLTRTNSESILGAMGDKYRPERDFSEGVAITSSFHPASDTHIEPVRYGKGSNAIAVLQTLLTDGGGRVPRWLLLILEILRNPLRAAKMFNYRRWSQRTVIVLVMQNLDKSLQTFVKRLGPFRYVSSKQGHGEPNPTWIPEGNEATRRLADKIDGTPGGTVGDIFNAHDRAFPRRLPHLGLAGQGRGGSVPPSVELPDDVDRRRLGELGQPRREPGPDHHRAGRACHVSVAQQGRARSASGAG